MQHRNYPTRLSLAAMLMSSVYLAACGGTGEGETSAQDTSAQEGETSARETSAQDGPTATAQYWSSYTWSKVADEGQTFTLASSTRVRYGSGKNWIYKRVSGTVSCTSRFFGYDPAPGVRKACYVRVAATQDPPPPPPPPPPTCPCSAWSESTTPTTPQESDPKAVELGVKFTTSSNGFITGIRFYKGTGNTGTHVGNLWSAGGALLARATFSAETASGWQQVNFASPVPVTANTVYVASYYAPAGNYAADLNYFATSGVSNGPINLLSSGAIGGNGVYRYSSTTTFPSSTFNATNYWVDIVFSDSGTTPPDTTPPTVSSVSPAAGATGVATTGAVSATFSEAMDAATIGASTFELRDAANVLVASNVSYDATTLTARLTPTAVLAASQTYTATVRGGSTDPRVTDAAGNALAALWTWSFTTGTGSPPPPATTGTATLSWTASLDANVSGYRVYYGNAPGSYVQSFGAGIDAGNTTTYVVNGLATGKTYYFAVTAVGAVGNESGHSNEASKLIQ